MNALSADVRHVVTDDGLLLFRWHSDDVFQANKCGCKIWLALFEGDDVSKVGSRVAFEYGVDRSVVDEDVQSFLNLLREKQFLLER